MDVIGEIIVKCQHCGGDTVVTLTKTEKNFVRCRQCRDFVFEYTGVRGYIYVLSNPKMAGLLKIGLSARPLQERIAELSSATGVPAPFELEAAFVSAEPEAHERQIHSELAEFRVPGREFFSAHITKVINVAESICKVAPFFLNPNNKHLGRRSDVGREKVSKSLDAWQQRRFNE
jgi:hypothetical protein